MIERWYPSLEAKRAACWAFGAQQRELLLQAYMRQQGLSERPFVKDVLDDIIADVLQAHLVEDVLPLDRYAQTEPLGGRIVVTINARIREMERVKHVAGIGFVSKCHEVIHVIQMHELLRGANASELRQAVLPGFEVEAPRLIVCRRFRRAACTEPDRAPQQCRQFGRPPEHASPVDPEESEREFIAENAGLALAIAGADLARCEAWRELEGLAARGGDLGGRGWRLLYATAEAIGVNPPALLRYFGHRGWFHIKEDRGGDDSSLPLHFVERPNACSGL